MQAISCAEAQAHHSCQAFNSMPPVKRMAVDLARRSQANANMVRHGLVLLPFMLHEECRPGPTWEYGNQWQEGMPMSSIYLPAKDMLEWVLSCLSCAHYEGCCPFTGWSPFRSVATNTGYYKVGDRGCWDIQLFKPLEDVDLWTWWDMTQKFARVPGSIEFVLKYCVPPLSCHHHDM